MNPALGGTVPQLRISHLLSRVSSEVVAQGRKRGQALVGASSVVLRGCPSLWEGVQGLARRGIPQGRRGP